MVLAKDAVIWNIGDTSFRRKNIIDETYELLKVLYKFNQTKDFKWKNLNTQLDYYIEVKDIITKEKSKKTKQNKDDAKYIEDLMKRSRTYTNGLVKIGFCSKERIVSDVGIQFLNVYEGNVKLEKDSFEELLSMNDINILYLRQMMKFNLVKECSQIYPIRLLMELLLEFKYLDKEELNLFLFIVDSQAYTEFKLSLTEYRAKKISYSTMKSKVLNIDMDKLENTDFISKLEVNDREISTLFSNRKSQQSGNKKIIELLEAIDRFVLNPSEIGYNNLKNTIQKQQYNTLKLKSALNLNKTDSYATWKRKDYLILNDDLETRRRELYKYISAQANMNTSKDYIDIFKRNINLTGLFDFKSSLKLSSATIENFTELVVIPKMNYNINPNSYNKVVNCEEIFNCNIADTILSQYNMTEDELRIGTILEHSNKLKAISQNYYTKETLITLLKLFIKDDSKSRIKIQELTTDNAKIPTIYEYVVGMAWFYISNYNFDLYKSLNLIMDGSMLPLTHAPGGRGDIEIVYPKSNVYNEHTLLIELTLMDKSNQRRNELEPVIRHGYNLKAENPSIENYSLFISNEIDENVMTIHSICNKLPFKTKDGIVNGIDIFALETSEILFLLEHDIKYEKIYEEFKSISVHSEYDVNKIINFRKKTMKKTN